jgi:hypothetical protein
MVGGFGRGVSHDVFLSDAKCWAGDNGSSSSSSSTVAWRHVNDRTNRLGNPTYGHTSAAVGPRSVGVFGGCTGGGYTDDVNDLLVLHLIGDLSHARGDASSTLPAAAHETTDEAQRLPVPGPLGVAIAEAQRQLYQEQEAPVSTQSDEAGDFHDNSRSRENGGNRLNGLRAIWQRPVLTEDSIIPTARAYASVTPFAQNNKSFTSRNTASVNSTKSAPSSATSDARDDVANAPVRASRETLLVFGGIHDEEATAAFEVAELSIQPAVVASDSKKKTKAMSEERAAGNSSSIGPVASCQVTWRVPRTTGELPRARFGHAAAFVPHTPSINANTAAAEAATDGKAEDRGGLESPRGCRTSHYGSLDHGHDRSPLGRLIVCGGSDGSDLLRNGTDLNDVFVLTWHGPNGSGAEEEDEGEGEGSYTGEGAHTSDGSSSNNINNRSSDGEPQRPPRFQRLRSPGAEGTWSEVSTHWRPGHVFPPGGLYMGRCCSSALIGRKLLVFGGGARLSNHLVTLDVDTFELARPSLLPPQEEGRNRDGSSSSSSGGGSSERNGSGGGGGVGMGALGIVPAVLRRYLGGMVAGEDSARQALVPAPRLSHAWWVYGGKVLLFGGFTRQGATDDAWLLTLYPTPDPRDAQHAATARAASNAHPQLSTRGGGAAAEMGNSGSRSSEGNYGGNELSMLGGGHLSPDEESEDGGVRSKLLLFAMLQRFGTASGRGEGAEAYLFPTESMDDDDDDDDDDDLWSTVASSEESGSIRYHSNSEEEEDEDEDKEEEGEGETSPRRDDEDDNDFVQEEENIPVSKGISEISDVTHEERTSRNTTNMTGSSVTRAAASASSSSGTDLQPSEPRADFTSNTSSEVDVDAETNALDAAAEADTSLELEAADAAPFRL